MKKFWIRTINVCVIVAALIGYSKVTLAHEQTDAAAKAEADRKNAEIAAAAGETGGSYTDGIYQDTQILAEVVVKADMPRCGYPVCRKRRQCLSDDGKRYHSGDPGCTERGCGYHQRCDLQLHRNQKCNGTGSCERRCQINETDE